MTSGETVIHIAVEPEIKVPVYSPLKVPAYSFGRVSPPPSPREVPVFYEYADRPHGIAISPSRLIDKHLSEIRRRMNMHSMAAAYYEYWGKLLGYPISIISGFLGSTLMYEYAMKKNEILGIVNLVFVGTLFLLSNSKDYLKYSDKNKSHDISSKLYTTLLRSNELRLLKGNNIDLAEKRDMSKDIIEQMTIIEQFDLIIPEHIIKKYVKQAHLE